MRLLLELPDTRNVYLAARMFAETVRKRHLQGNDVFVSLFPGVVTHATGAKIDAYCACCRENECPCEGFKLAGT